MVHGRVSFLLACCAIWAGGTRPAHGQIYAAYPEYAVGHGDFVPPTGNLASCFCDPGPCWLGQATFDILLFDRSDADPMTIVTDTAVPGNELLNTTDLGFPLTAGFRFNLVLPGDNACDFMFSYLGVRPMNSRVHSSTATEYSFFEFSGLQPVDPAITSYETMYVSRLNSLEINSRFRNYRRIAPIAGVRFLEVNDEFERRAFDGGNGILKSTETDNELWGFQVGADALIYDTGPMRIQTTMKAGVYYNDLELMTGGGNITVGATTIDPAFVNSAGRVAYLGELSLEAVYRFGRHVSMRAGYTMMWIDGIALAPDQHDDFLATTGTGTFDLTTTLFHGSFVGVEVTW